MSQTIRFCFVLHNHQPVGNFEGVFEQAYRDSYLPMLDTLEPYKGFRFALHTSGSLMEWLDQNHPEYVDRLARLVTAGRIEIIGGAFFEPILTMIRPCDRHGQITEYTWWLEQRLGGKVQGAWVPERVWEQSLTSDLVRAGIKYVVLDDFHFKNAGLSEDELHGYYVTEDDGQLLGVFPGSERLRYVIPFGAPQETIDYLGHIAGEHPGAVIVFGDDGEKFGMWPETKRHVYGNGWLREFLDLLAANRHWIDTTTLADAFENAAPLGKIYLPEGSYREMTEWALPVERQLEYEDLKHKMQSDGRWPQVAQFIRGGFWRNFRVKYPEANEMYTRMMMVSRQLESAVADGASGELIDRARRDLYRGQCNCAYWHGAFGGIYLPHLRNAVYHHLISADNLIEKATGRLDGWVEATVEDYNFDAKQEIRLANDKLLAFLAPAHGGQMYELDVRSIRHNLLATLTRRVEAYHRKVLAGAARGGNDGAASIHDRVIFKQEGLDQRLQYDRHPRKSLLDHFYDVETTLESVVLGKAQEQGDFLDRAYETKVRRNPGRIQVQLSRSGSVFGLPIQITKGVTLDSNSSMLEIAYLLEGVPQDRPLHFGVEFNFSGLPAGADDRYFYRGGARLGQLGTVLDLTDASDLGLVDEWLGIDVRLSADRPTQIWAFPIETVSQSEGGFELIHQSVVVQPHWFVQGDAEGRWSVTMRLEIDTSRAENRLEGSAVAATT